MTVLAPILEALSKRRFRCSTEDELQVSIADVLDAAGILARREVRLSDTDVVDFMIAGVGLEVKVDGSLPALTRQLARYAAHGAVDALVVVTTRARLTHLPEFLGGKPVHVIHLVGGI